MNDFKKTVVRIGVPRLIMSLFLLALIAAVAVYQLQLGMTLGQCIVRSCINMLLALAMVPAVKSGIGLNFGLPLGISCGLVAGLISLEYNMTGIGGIICAWTIAIPLAMVAGFAYGLLMNKVRGSELMVGTYIGFSIVAIMCIAWMKLPFKNPRIGWSMGEGLRVTITLDGWYDKALNRLWAFDIAGVTIPTGLLLTCAFFCFIIWLFTRSRAGMCMMAGGSNPNFARFNGINPSRTRILGAILSTVLGAIGIIFYAQGFGFYQLYSAPMTMAFPAVAAVLIGGASSNKISISNVVLGTFLFQSILSLASPVAGAILPEGNLAEVFRIIISNGIILYALSKSDGGIRK